ncbi:MAG TPA: helix-turn-helix domain-containing protein [Candidatus Butyricimonas faecavium]|nr:helix-turn-helix domain-containing protein [Candidatus Butyricimonas faecavium]
MSFSERLQKVMDEKGYTKYKVAKALHMSATTISNYLKSKTKPDTTKLEVISLLLGVNRKWLLTGEGEKYRKGNAAVEKTSGDLSVRDNDEFTVRHLVEIVDKQASLLQARDEEVRKLMTMNEILLGKLTILLEKILEKL